MILSLKLIGSLNWLISYNMKPNEPSCVFIFNSGAIVLELYQSLHFFRIVSASKGFNSKCHTEKQK